MASMNAHSEELEPAHAGALGPGETSAGTALLELEPGADVESWQKLIDDVYRSAGGDAARIPWAHRRPNPAMLNWLNADAPSLVRPGARVCVVGCGLGEDACALAERGYDVTAIDCSASAIEWARRLHPHHDAMFVQADLLDLPVRLQRRFDLVVEVHTLQALPPQFRDALAGGMAKLLTGKGVLLAVARGRDPKIRLEEVHGPPFALTGEELVETLGRTGLAPIRPIDDFFDDNSPPVRRLRGVFRRS